MDGWKDSAGEWVDDRREQVEGWKDSAGEWVDDRREQVEDWKDSAGDWLDDRREQISGWKDRAEDFVDDVRDQAEDLKDRAFDAIRDGRDRAGEWVVDRWDDARSWTDDQRDAASDWIQDKIDGLPTFPKIKDGVSFDAEEIASLEPGQTEQVFFKAKGGEGAIPGAEQTVSVSANEDGTYSVTGSFDTELNAGLKDFYEVGVTQNFSIELTADTPEEAAEIANTLNTAALKFGAPLVTPGRCHQLAELPHLLQRVW